MQRQEIRQEALRSEYKLCCDAVRGCESFQRRRVHTEEKATRLHILQQISHAYSLQQLSDSEDQGRWKLLAEQVLGHASGDIVVTPQCFAAPLPTARLQLAVCNTCFRGAAHLLCAPRLTAVAMAPDHDA